MQAQTHPSLQSDDIGELVKALAAVQGLLTPAVKETNNPFYDKKYANLESVWQSCRQLLADNGLTVMQSGIENSERNFDRMVPKFNEKSKTLIDTLVICEVVTLETLISHSSGQWKRGLMGCTIVDSNPQKVGGAVTYLRRYGLAAMLGIVTDDDDGEAAMGRSGSAKSKAKTPAPRRQAAAPAAKTATSTTPGGAQHTAAETPPPRRAAPAPQAKTEASGDDNFEKGRQQIMNLMHLRGREVYGREKWEEVRTQVIVDATGGRVMNSENMTDDEVHHVIKWLEGLLEGGDPAKVEDDLAMGDATPTAGADEFPHGANVEEQTLPVPVGQEPWGATVIHFGKLKGVALGDLNAESLKWWQENWYPKAFQGSVSQENLDLREALNTSMDG